MEWLTYLSTELHKNLGALFHKKEAGLQFVETMTHKIERRMKFMDDHLSKNKFLLGEGELHSRGYVRHCDPSNL